MPLTQLTPDQYKLLYAVAMMNRGTALDPLADATSAALVEATAPVAARLRTFADALDQSDRQVSALVKAAVAAAGLVPAGPEKDALAKALDELGTQPPDGGPAPAPAPAPPTPG
jgi:hypothetical protein